METKDLTVTKLIAENSLILYGFGGGKMKFIISKKETQYTGCRKVFTQKGLSIYFSEKNEKTFELISVVNESELLLIYGNLLDQDYKSPVSTDLLLEIFREKEIDAVKKINSYHGIYFGVYLSIKNKKALFFSDRFGIMPTYYYGNKKMFILSDNIEEMIEDVDKPIDVNLSGISEFLFFGNPIGTSTYYKGISRLREEQFVTIKTNNMKMKIGDLRVLQEIQIDNKISATEAADKVITLLRESMENIVNNQPTQKIIFLSGGWDSRFLAGLLKEFLTNFSTFTTYGDDGDDKDKFFASLVAKELQIKNQYIPLSEDYFEKYQNTCIKENNYETILHVWLKEFVDKLDIKDLIHLDGFAGDRFLKGFMERGLTNEIPKTFRPSFIDSTFCHFKMNDSFEKLLNSCDYFVFSKLAWDSIKNELKRYEGNPNVYTLFLLNNRTRRNIGYSITQIQSKKYKTILPFLNNKFVDYVLTISPEIRSDPQFYKLILSKFNKQLSDLPSTNELTPAVQSKIEKKDIYKYKFENILRIENKIQSLVKNVPFVNHRTLSEYRLNVKQQPDLIKPTFKGLERVYALSLWFNEHEQNINLYSKENRKYYKRILPSELFQYKFTPLNKYKDTLSLNLFRLNDWQYFGSNKAGFITVRCPLPVEENQISKATLTCNSELLVNKKPSNFTEMNQYCIYPSNGMLYVTIDNTANRWNSSHPPSTQDIYNYFQNKEYCLHIITKEYDLDYWKQRVKIYGSKQELTPTQKDWEIFGLTKRGYIIFRVETKLNPKEISYLITKNNNVLSEINPNKFTQPDEAYLYRNGYVYITVDEQNFKLMNQKPTPEEIDQFFRENSYCIHWM